jgi:subtilisin family serine protease
MQHAITQTRLARLMQRTRGHGTRIGIVDGPVQGDGRDPASLHGAFVASLFTTLCPEAALASAPIFGPNQQNSSPNAVAAALHHLLDARVDAINLSIGVPGGGSIPAPALTDACERAEALGIPIFAAAGNQARIGAVPLARHPWVIPVAASRPDAGPAAATNLGPSTAARGLLAPGWRLQGFAYTGGTSQATAFVTATFALLRALIPATTTSTTLRAALILSVRHRPSIVPPLLDAEAAHGMLKR